MCASSRFPPELFEVLCKPTVMKRTDHDGLVLFGSGFQHLSSPFYAGRFSLGRAAPLSLTLNPGKPENACIENVGSQARYVAANFFAKASISVGYNCGLTFM
jgi:hypothetical protein